LNCSLVDSRQPSPESKVKVMIPMYQPPQITKSERCGRTIAEPK
jgi:hypothetical protein